MQILGVQIILYFYHHNFLRKALTIFTSVTIYMRNIVRCLLFAFQFRKSITDENRPLGEFWKNTKDLKLKILIRKIDDQVQASWRNREERRGRRTVFIFTEFRELLPFRSETTKSSRSSWIITSRPKSILRSRTSTNFESPYIKLNTK